MQFLVDFFLIIRQLPKPIRGLRNQAWLDSCSASEDSDFNSYGDTNIPCAENIVLIIALCFPVFLVVQFDTGIFYQVAVFFYGCLNGLLVLGLGQVVTWNDLVRQFEKGKVSAPFACWLLDSRLHAEAVDADWHVFVLYFLSTSQDIQLHYDLSETQPHHNVVGSHKSSFWYI